VAAARQRRPRRRENECHDAIDEKEGDACADGDRDAGAHQACAQLVEVLEDRRSGRRRIVVRIGSEGVRERGD